MENKHGLTNHLMILGLIVVIVIMALNQQVVVSSADNTKDTISVSGSAEITVDPDKADIYVSVVSIEDTALDAKKVNSKTSEDIINALKGEGIGNNMIETFRFNIGKKQVWDGVKRKYVSEGYEATHTLKVTTEDVEYVGKLIDAAVSAGANDVDRVSFGLTDEKQKDVNEQALTKASKEAKEKAESLTSALGVRLGRIMSISESNFYFEPYDYYLRSSLNGMKMEESSTETLISPQDVEVKATVSLVYDIN